VSATTRFYPVVFFDIQGNFLKVSHRKRFVITYDPRTDQQNYHCQLSNINNLFYLFDKKKIAMPLDEDHRLIFNSIKKLFVYPTNDGKVVFLRDYLGNTIFPRNDDGKISFPENKNGKPILPKDSKGRSFKHKLYGFEEYIRHCYQKLKKEGSIQLILSPLLSTDPRNKIAPSIKSLPPILEAKYQILSKRLTYIFFQNFPNIQEHVANYFKNKKPHFTVKMEPMKKKDTNIIFGYTITVFSLKGEHFQCEPSGETDRMDKWKKA